jgi:hypothetical protein
LKLSAGLVQPQPSGNADGLFALVELAPDTYVDDIDHEVVLVPVRLGQGLDVVLPFLGIRTCLMDRLLLD